MQKIRTLEVRACRGIRDAVLDFNGMSIVLQGENGLGKSSFVDALEFLFKGKIAHLDEAKSTSTKRHTPHIHFKDTDTRVELKTIDPDATHLRTFMESTSDPEHQRSFLELGEDTNFILRRKELLDFIIAKPAGRYEQIAQVIGVGGLEDIELNLMRRRDELAQATEDLNAQVASAMDDLRKLIDSEASSDDQILEALNRRLVSLKQSALSSFGELEEKKLAAIQSTKDPEQVERAARIQGLANLIASVQDLADVIQRHTRFWTSLDELRNDRELARTLAFDQVLEQSMSLIQEFEPQECPVCEQPVDHRKLFVRLEERLALMEGARERSLEVSKLAGGLGGDLQTIIKKLSELKQGFSEFSPDLDTSPISAYSDHLAPMYEQLQLEPVRMKVKSAEELIPSTEVSDWENFAEGAVKELANQSNQMAVSDKDKLALQAIELIAGFEELRHRIGDLERASEVKSAVAAQIQLAYGLFIKTKQDEIKGIYEILESDMQQYYDMLHPQEGHRSISLEIDPKKRGSTEIKMGFHDYGDEDPRAFQSEAHLDSLGLCAFLAFVKNFNKEFPLVVLDDVVSTIDAQHRTRICELLYTEFDDYQLFVTTHDALWFDELVHFQRAFNVGHRFRNLRILDWSLEEGVRFDRHKPRWNRVEELLDDGDKVSAAAHTRRNLEWILQEMSVTTLTKVPIAPSGRYTAADLYDPFKRRIRKLRPEVYDDNKDLFVSLEGNSLFGNLLVHNNLYAENASIDEIRDFSAAVMRFHALFTCERGQFIKYHQAANLMKCRCGHIEFSTN